MHQYGETAGPFGTADMLMLMRLFRTTLHIDYQPGQSLRLRLRPSLAMCIGLAISYAAILLSIPSMQWQAITATALLFAFPAFFLSVMVWHTWSDVTFPTVGSLITWRDGPRLRHLPSDRILAARLDFNVQPKLHKGPGPTTFINLWVADQQLLTASPDADPWVRVFTIELSPTLIVEPSSAASDPAKLISTALHDLGYPTNLPIKT